MIDAIIFDIGNVLLRFDFSWTIRRIAPFCSVAPSEIHGLLEPWKNQLESGRICGEAFLKEAAAVVGYRGEMTELRLAWQEIFAPIEATHRLVERWHGKRPLYLLSNTNDLHAEYFLNQYSVFGLFENAVYSHEVGLMKPDAAIYAHTLEKFRLEAGRTLFIDDLAPNVESARASGLVVHHYHEQRHEALLEQAGGLGLM